MKVRGYESYGVRMVLLVQADNQFRDHTSDVSDLNKHSVIIIKEF